MANKRMFSKEITDSDAFIDMPLSSQALYFHLGMTADDDGFINNPKRIQRSIGASNDDMTLLFAKGFVIPFESGIVVIKHWRINNTIQKDRYHPTKYQEEYALLSEKTNKAYTLTNSYPELGVSSMDTECIQDVSNLDTQIRLDKVRLGKTRKDKDACVREDEKAQTEPKHKHGEFSNVLLTDKELDQLKAKFPDDWEERIDDLSYYIGSKGDKYKSHYRTILSWQRKNEPKGVSANADYSKYR